jgi:protein ImuA
MTDSSAKLARLRLRIDALARPAQATAGVFSLGEDALDTRLGGGLAIGALHEVVFDDATSASGFALMLALRSGAKGRPILWVVTDKAERMNGGIYAPGLIDLGGNPDDIVMVHAPDELAALRVAADIIGCAGVAAAIIDAGEAKKLDLTASRRLSLAAEKSGVTGIVLRASGSSFASAASTRWQVTAAPSKPLAGDAPGQTALRLELLRHRGGIAPFEMILEWDRDAQSFCAPALSGAVLPLSGPRTVADAVADGERRAA